MGAGLTQMGFVTKIPEKLPWAGEARWCQGRRGQVWALACQGVGAPGLEVLPAEAAASHMLPASTQTPPSVVLLEAVAGP